MAQAVLPGQAVSLLPAPLNQDRINASAATVLPDDLLTQVLSFLSPEDLARACGVCRDWNKVALDLWNEFDLNKICKVIDQAVWERHVDLATLGLDASGAPAIDKRVAISLIKRLSRQVEGDAGVTLLTMPKGLTLNKLIALAAAPKKGRVTQFRHIWPEIRKKLGNVAVDKTYIVAITNFVLKDSRKKSIDAQRALAQAFGGDLAGILPVATVVFLTYICSPAGKCPMRLYGKKPLTFTRCSEQVMQYSVVVGGFAPSGLNALCTPKVFHDDGAAVAKTL